MIALALGLQWIVVLAVAAIFAGHRRASLLHPLALYLVFHALVFVLRPTLVHALDFDTQWRLMQLAPDPALFLLTLAVASFGLVIFAAVALAADGRDEPPPATPSLTGVQRQGFRLMLLLLLPWALAGAWQDARLFGTFAGRGEAGMVIDAQSAHTYFRGTTGYLVKAHNLLVPMAALFAWVHRFRWWAFLPLLAVVAYRAYLGSRWGMVLGLAIVLLLYLVEARRRWPPAVAVLVAVPLLLGFYAVGQNRDALRNMLGVGEARYAQVAPWPPRDGWDRLDTPGFANFDYLAYILAVVPERSGTHSWFTQHLELFTRPVPRMLWPGKPRGPPIRLVDLNAHGWFGTRTPSLVGDGWMSAGWLGVALTCGGVAWGLARLYAWFAQRRHLLFPVALYCCALPAALMWFRGGALVSFARYGFWMVLPVLVWWGLAHVLGRLAAREAVRQPAPRSAS